jgi:hypothetical protein
MVISQAELSGRARHNSASLESERVLFDELFIKLGDDRESLSYWFGGLRGMFTMNPSEQTVDFAGDARERYTDVYAKQNGAWMALSVQETEIAP